MPKITVSDTPLADASPTEPVNPTQPVITPDTPATQDAPAITLDSFNPDEPQDFAPAPETPVTPPAETEDREDSATPEEDSPEPEKPGEPPTEKPSNNKRDYSRFPEDDRAKLRQMSNAAFERYSKTWDEKVALETRVKELESKTGKDGAFPDNWYEHESAYQLSPEYQEASRQLAGVEQEAAFNRSQLSAVKRGEKWFVPGRDQRGNLVPCVVGPSGTLIPSNEGMEPTPEAEAMLVEAMSTAAQIRSQIASKASGLREKFTAEHKGAREFVENAVKANAPWSEKADDPLTKWAEQYRTTQLPKAYQNHPLAKAHAHSLAYALAKEQRVKQLEDEVKALKGVKSDARKAPPVPTNRKTTVAPTKQRYSLEDLQRLESLEEEAA